MAILGVVNGVQHRLRELESHHGWMEWLRRVHILWVDATRRVDLELVHHRGHLGHFVPVGVLERLVGDALWGLARWGPGCPRGRLHPGGIHLPV